MIHYRDFNNGNALYWAIVHGSANIFQELIKSGLDPLMRTRKNENLLHVCAMYGAPQFVSELINKHGVDPKLEDSTKKTPLDRSDPFLCPTSKNDVIFSSTADTSCAFYIVWSFLSGRAPLSLLLDLSELMSEYICVTLVILA